MGPPITGGWDDMPMTTYRSPDERPPTNHAEINSLLADARKLTQEDWVVDEYEITRSKRVWFRRVHTFQYAYRVCVGIGGIEYQVINFESEEGEGTTMVPARMVLAFFYGLLAGIKAGQNAHARALRAATKAGCDVGSGTDHDQNGEVPYGQTHDTDHLP